MKRIAKHINETLTPTILTSLAALATAILMLAAASCSPRVSGETEDEPSAVVSKCSYFDDDFRQCEVTLDDTRRVVCVETSRGGVSCDWAHTDGADKGWDE